MRVFQVRQGSTGAVLWTGAAAGEMQAIDAMAHEAGYYDHSDLPDGLRLGGISVEELSLGILARTAPGGTVRSRRFGGFLGRGGLQAGRTA